MAFIPEIEKTNKPLVLEGVNIYTKNKMAYFVSFMKKSQKSQENTLSHIISPKYYHQDTCY